MYGQREKELKININKAKAIVVSIEEKKINVKINDM